MNGTARPRRALVTGAAGGIGAAIAARLREDDLEVTTLDRAKGCDIRMDLVSDPIPDLSDIDICVSNQRSPIASHSLGWGREPRRLIPNCR